MLKLSASFSKKVPAEREFSSKSYHAAIETELPDGLSPEQLRQRISSTFALVRESVEGELGNGSNSNGNIAAPAPPPANHNKENNQQPASPKQTGYLRDLAKQAGMDLDGVVRKRFNINSPFELSRTQCSQLINEILKTRAA